MKRSLKFARAGVPEATIPDGDSKAESEDQGPDSQLGSQSFRRQRVRLAVISVGAVVILLGGAGVLYFQSQNSTAIAANQLPKNLPILKRVPPVVGGSATTTVTGNVGATVPTTASSGTAGSVTTTTLSPAQLVATKNPFTPLASSGSSNSLPG